ncbi:MAG: MltA domain-containing protein [Candidatus Riflebacteria bacterium]|nr:MltA domain-containing protein [Candidatus Riflebacteria bacterium]
MVRPPGVRRLLEGLLWAIALATMPAGPGRAETDRSLREQVEACLLERFQETSKDQHRTDYAVLLSTRLRHAAREGGPGADLELRRILELCRESRPYRPLPLGRPPRNRQPLLVDGGSLESLRAVLDSARRSLSRARGTVVPFGTGRVPAGDLLRGVQTLRTIVDRAPEGPGGLARSAAEPGGIFRDGGPFASLIPPPKPPAGSPSGLARAVLESFDLYRSPGAFGTGEVLFTSYASPVYDGSLQAGGRFRYPIYRSPATAGLPVRALDRAGIYAGGLAGHGLEIAYLAERMDEFQIQIEGSGFIRLPDGTFIHATYAAQNGRPYRSLGKELVRDGVFKPWEIDNPAVRRYFHAHPEQERPYLERNPSFVFFGAKRLDSLPDRSALVPERAVAVDPRFFPRGALAFADTFVPIYDREGRLAGRRPWRRFIVAQDVGGAVKGEGRIDLYQGQGEEAQLIADTMKEPGTLWLLLPKGSRPTGSVEPEE